MLVAILQAEMGAEERIPRLRGSMPISSRATIAMWRRYDGKPRITLHAPGLDDLDLAPRRRVGAAAGHHRHRAGVTPHRLARRHAAVAEAERVRDQHQVAGTHAVQREAASAEDRHRLAILRRIEHRPRQAGGAAARLQHQRHALAVGGREAHEIAERRIALDAVANLRHAVRRELRAGRRAIGCRRPRCPAPQWRWKNGISHRASPSPGIAFPAARAIRRATGETRMEIVRRRRVVARERIEVERAPIPGHRLRIVIAIL